MLQELDLDWANWLVINWGAIFKIARSQLLEGDWWQKGRWHFLEGGCSYYIKKQVWNIWRLKKNNEQFADLRRGMVKKWGWFFWVFEWWGTGVHTLMYTVLYTTLIGKPLPLLTYGISTALPSAILVLLLLKQHYYVQCPYHSLARNPECLLLYFCRCHYFVEQWAISLRCVIIVRSWVSKDFVVSGILIANTLTDLNFLCLSYK